MLLGRQDELSAVLEACRAAVGGRGSVLVLTGEPGIGKSALPLAATPVPCLRHGTAVCEVIGGRGQLAGACGSIASSFLLADTGELSGHHLGLLFLEQAD